jgi:hypothetical protein
MTQASGPVYGAVEVPADVWGVDAAMAGVLTDAQLRALADFDLGSLKLPGYTGANAPTGKPRVLWGYTPLPGNSSAWDWTAERLRAGCDAGFLCGSVQHCRSGLWLASAAQGDADGKQAAECAAKIGYPSACHHAQDDEAVRNPGPQAYASVTAWCKAYDAYGKACEYEGYEPGVTETQAYANPYVDRYWGAPGPWDVATRSVCCRQGPTVRIGGIAYDVDHFFADKLGSVLTLMGRIDLWTPSA